MTKQAGICLLLKVIWFLHDPFKAGVPNLISESAKLCVFLVPLPCEQSMDNRSYAVICVTYLGEIHLVLTHR